MGASFAHGTSARFCGLQARCVAGLASVTVLMVEIVFGVTAKFSPLESRDFLDLLACDDLGSSTTCRLFCLV